MKYVSADLLEEELEAKKLTGKIWFVQQQKKRYSFQSITICFVLYLVI